MDRGEKRALWIAGAGHLALVGFLSVGILSTSRKLPPVDDVMPVDIVDIAAVPSTPRPVPRTAPEQGPDETPEETAEPEEQTPAPEPKPVDRKSVVLVKCVSVRVTLVCRALIKKHTHMTTNIY